MFFLSLFFLSFFPFSLSFFVLFSFFFLQYFPSLLCLFLSSRPYFYVLLLLTLFLISIRSRFIPQNKPVSITLSQLLWFTHDLLSYTWFILFYALYSFFFHIHRAVLPSCVATSPSKYLISFPLSNENQPDSWNLPTKRFQSQKGICVPARHPSSRTQPCTAAA